MEDLFVAMAWARMTLKYFPIFMFLAISASAQQETRSHATLFFNADVCSTGGPNSTFTQGGGDGARAVSKVIEFLVRDRAGTISVADHAMLEVRCDKGDDDSLIVLLLGDAYGDTSRVYLDTVYVPLTIGATSYVMLSPSFTSESYIFPPSGKFSIANADSGNTGQFPYFGEVADTNIWSMRLILWLY